MNKSKKLGIAMMVLVVLTLLSTTVAALEFIDNLKEKAGNFGESISDLFGSYKFVIVNTLIISALLITIIALYPKIEQRQRLILQFIAIAAAFLIAWKMLPDDSYLWSISNVAHLLHLKIWINVLVIAAVGFILINLPKVGDKLPKEGIAKYAVYIAILVIAFLIAINPIKEPLTGEIKDYPGDTKYHYIWERESIIPWKFRLLGDSRCYAFDAFGYRSVDSKHITIDDTEYRTNKVRLGDGEEYYINEEGNLYHYDNNWYLPAWAQWDEKIGNVKDEKYKKDYKKQFELAEKYDPVKRGDKNFSELSDTERGELFNIIPKIEDESRAGRYCYTEQSLADAYAGKKNSERADIHTNIHDPNFKGFGILRGRHLFIFVFGTILLIWLFGYLLGEQNKWINYLIAVILASNMAHSGIGWNTFILLAEGITWYILYRAISKGEATTLEGRAKLLVNLAISFFLTYFIYKTAFPTNHIVIPVVEKMGVMGYVGIVLGVIVIGLLIGVGAKKGVKWLASATGLKGILSDLWLAVIRNPLMKAMLERKSARRLREFIRETGDIAPRYTKTGEIPKVYKEYGHLINVWMDYMLRLEAFLGKFGIVKKNVLTLAPWAERLGKDFALNRFSAHMDWFKNGPRFFIFDDDEQMKEIIQRWEEKMEKGKTKKDRADARKRLKELKRRYEEYRGKEKLEIGKLNAGTVIDISNEYYDENIGTIGTGETAELSTQQKEPRGCLAHYRLGIEALRFFTKLFTDEAIKTPVMRGDKLQEDKENKIRPLLKPLKKLISKDNRESYNSYFRRYTNILLMRAVESEMLDQYLIPGEYNHTYLFANPGARVEYYTWKIKKPSKELPKERDIELDEEIKPPVEELKSKGYVLKHEGKYEDSRFAGHLKFKRIGEGEEVDFKEFFHEVDYDGKFIDDYYWVKNAVVANMPKSKIEAKKPYIRKLKQTWWIWQTQQRLNDEGEDGPTILRKGNYYEAAEWLQDVWDTFIFDMRFGNYHPNSKVVSDYKSSWSLKQDYGFKDVTKFTGKEDEKERKKKEKIQRSKEPGEGDPSFDMEACKNPAMVYWGVKRYDDEIKTINYAPANPYPSFSTTGLSKFIKFLYEKSDGNVENTRIFLQKFVKDTAEEKLGLFAKPYEEEEIKEE